MNNKFPLEQIVREYMVEDLGLNAIDRRYSRILQIAISGLRNLNYDSPHFGLKEVVLPVSSNDTATLPEDYLDYYALGVTNDVGELQVYSMNSNLTNLRTDACGDLTPNASANARMSKPFFKMFENEGYVALYGDFKSSVVLRYKSDISKIDGTYQVFAYDVEALKDWIWWRYIRRQKSYGLQEVRDAKRDYGKSKKIATMRHAKFSMSEFMDALRSGYSVGPRI
jgi:hypothetical protein